jgi:hypothetical protein
MEFAIVRYDSSDWRLLKWDGSTETEIGAGWDHQPSLRECADALMDHHGTGSSPFSSREGSLDSLELSYQWPLATRDMTLTDETMPWND